MSKKNASSQRNLIIFKDYSFHMLNFSIIGLKSYIHPEFGIERLSRWSNFDNLGSELVLFCFCVRLSETWKHECRISFRPSQRHLKIFAQKAIFSPFYFHQNCMISKILIFSGKMKKIFSVQSLFGTFFNAQYGECIYFLQKFNFGTLIKQSKSLSIPLQTDKPTHWCSVPEHKNIIILHVPSTFW